MATDSHLDLETRYCRGVKLNTLRHKAGYATPFPNPSTVPRKILGTTEHSRNAAGAGLGPYRSIIIELLGEERADLEHRRRVGVGTVPWQQPQNLWEVANQVVLWVIEGKGDVAFCLSGTLFSFHQFLVPFPVCQLLFVPFLPADQQNRDMGL